jgi:DNA-binding transcriptional LysR family regulator
MSSSSDFGAPLAVAGLMEGFGRPWCIAGGWAIDLFLGRQTRPHKDVEIAIFRDDQRRLFEHLAGWTINKSTHPDAPSMRLRRNCNKDRHDYFIPAKTEIMRPRMDRLHGMRVLVEIVDRGSLTKAAESLDLSLPSVVRTLAALEEQLGARLLHRTTRRIALTEEGRDYLERCRRILSDVADAEAALSARDAVLRGALIVGGPVMFGRLHLVPLVGDFMERHPELRVELLLVDRVVNLVEEGIDASIRIGALPESSLLARPLGEVRRVLCASPSYLAKHGTPKKPSDLREHACVRVTALGSEHEFGSTPFTTNQIDAALDACVRGIGIGSFLSYQVERAVAKKRLAILLAKHEPAPIPVSIVRPPGRIIPSRLRAFLDFAAPRLQRVLSSQRSHKQSPA